MRNVIFCICIALVLFAPALGLADNSPFDNIDKSNEAANVIYQVLEDVLNIFIWVIKEIVQIFVDAIKDILPDFGFGGDD